MEERERKGRKLPFRQPARVGNFRVSRRFVDVGSGRSVPVIVVSDLEGLWSVQVPSTSQMYGVLTGLYATGEEADEGIMHTMLCSLYMATSIPGGHFHKGVLMLARVYMHPESLDDGAFLAEVRALADEYRSFAASRPVREMTDGDYDRAEAADGIMHA